MTDILENINIILPSKEIENNIYHKWELMDKPKHSLGDIEKIVAKR